MVTTLHPATVHFPIALLLLAAAAGLLHLYWRQHTTLRLLTWWPLLLGWLGNGVAIATGLLAQSGLPPQAPYRAVLNWHITTGLALWLVAGLLLYRAWLQGKPRRRGKGVVDPPNPDLLLAPAARLGLTLAFVLIIFLVWVSGWNGGKLVYEWGVNVMP
jgi:uncharacterized membrane protein